MKSAGKLIILLLMSIYLVSLLGFIQVVQEKPDKDERMAAINTFNHKYDKQFKIRKHSSTGTPATILGHKITKYSGTPEQIAKTFLNEEKIMFGIENVQRDLKLTRTNYSDEGGSSLMFTQIYNGVPILGSGYLVVVDNDGSVYYVSGDYFPDVTLDTDPSLNKGSITDIIISDISAQEITSTSEPVLYIYVNDMDSQRSSFSLVYKSIIITNNPYDEINYIIDAHSGEIISKGSLISKVTGSGEVFETNPIQYDEVISVDLLGLNDAVGGYYYLDGENVKIESEDPETYPDAKESTPEFDYDTWDHRFGQVMCYFHADSFLRWLDRKGLDLNDVPKITITTNYPHPVFARSSRYYPIIQISDGSGYQYRRNPTHEAAIIAHEVMHQVTRAFGVLQDNDLDKMPKAMNEAYSDFFALSYKSYILGSANDEIGEWVELPGGNFIKRFLDNEHTMDEYDYIEIDYAYPLTTDAYDRCVIYSGALWDVALTEIFGFEFACFFVLKSLELYMDDAATFLDGRDALKSATYHYLENTYLFDDIDQAFYNHLIYEDLIVSIDGMCLEHAVYEWDNKWWGVVSHGAPDYSYEWYIRVDDYDWCEETVCIDSVYFLERHGWEELVELFPTLDIGSLLDLKLIVTDIVEESEYDVVYNMEVVEAQKKIATEQLPKIYKLEQNYPNPFNPVTTIKFQLPKTSNVTLVIYNIQGQEVARLVDGYVEAGYHSIPWKPEMAASGIYIYRLQAGSFSDTKRMLYIK